MYRRKFRQRLSFIFILAFLFSGICFETNKVDSCFATEKYDNRAVLTAVKASVEQVAIKPEISSPDRLYSNLTERSRFVGRRTTGNRLHAVLWLFVTMLMILLSLAFVIGYERQSAVLSRRFIIAYIHHQDGEKASFSLYLRKTAKAANNIVENGEKYEFRNVDYCNCGWRSRFAFNIVPVSFTLCCVGL